MFNNMKTADYNNLVRQKLLVTAFYKLTHVVTERIFVGCSTSLYNSIAQQRAYLKRGIFKQKALQDAYKQDPQFKLQYIETATIDEAYDLKQAFLDNHPDPQTLLNASKQSARAFSKGVVRTSADDEKKMARTKQLRATLGQHEMIKGMTEGDFYGFSKQGTEHPAFVILYHQATGKFFAGSTGNLYRYLKGFRGTLDRGNYSGTLMREAYALDPFLMLYYTECGSRSDAFKLEQAVVDKYLSAGIMLNVSTVADTTVSGTHLPDELKEHLSEVHSERMMNTPEGQAARARFSDRMTKLWQTDEWREKSLKRLASSREDPAVIEKLKDCLAIPVIINGVRYRSKTEAARNFNINNSTLQIRILHGYRDWKVVEVIDGVETPVVPLPRPSKAKAKEDLKVRTKAVTINGVRYASYAAAAAAYGIHYDCLCGRLRHGYPGWSVTIHGKSTKKRAVIFNGIKYQTVGQAAESIGVPTPTFYYRSKKGFPGYGFTYVDD